MTDALVGRLVDGRYQVVGLVARGGMATVYEAVDQRLDRRVALKVMHPVYAEDPEFVERFISEARSAARLSHPGIVAVFDQGTDGDVVYLAMEFVDGHTLRQLLRQNGKLSAEDALAILDPAIDALGAAHRAGIVHRDVKPENILVAADGRVRVADFGLARAVDGSTTATRGVLLGTVAYVSPEQTLGQAATPRSDVYAAGVVLYELLTGHPPHTGATDFIIARKHTEEDVPAPSVEVTEVPALVDDLVRRATARDPQQRYASAGELLTAVRRARRVLDVGPYEVEPWEAAGVSSAQALGHPAVTGRAPAAAEVLDRSDTAAYARTAGDQRTSVIAPVARADGKAGDGSGGRRAAPPGQRISRKAVVWFILVLALAIGAGVGAWWYGAARYTQAPSLLGLTVDEAQAKATLSGLEARQSGEGFSETVPVGIVVGTDPGPGERVLKDGTVGLIVSRGPERYAVPDLTGKARDDAEDMLAELKLVAGTVTEQHSDAIPEGSVVSQGTPAGTQVRPDTEVAFVVSLGRKPLTIPDLAGQRDDDAEEELEDEDFEVERRQEFSATVERGRVIGTEPAGGASAFPRDTVTLIVSKGPENVEVPNVEGKSLEEARRLLEEVGFKVDVDRVLPGGPGNVIQQQPAGGREVKPDSTVRLWIW